MHVKNTQCYEERKYQATLLRLFKLFHGGVVDVAFASCFGAEDISCVSTPLVWL